MPETEEVGEEERGSGTAVVERLLPNGVLEIGERDAPLTLLVVTEHHCRYCKEFHGEQLPSLMKEFVDAGDLRIQIAILPLRKYAGSELGARASFCAAKQNAGLAMHRRLFTLPEVTRDAVAKSIGSVGMDGSVFHACLDDAHTGDILASQHAWLRAMGVTLVPTFFLNGEKSVGLPEIVDLGDWIEEALEAR